MADGAIVVAGDMPWRPSEHPSWYVDPAALGEPPRDVVAGPPPRPQWHHGAIAVVLLGFFLALGAAFGALPSLAILLAGREIEAELVSGDYVKRYRFEVDGESYEGEGISGKPAAIDDAHIRVSYVAFAPSINDPYGSAPGRPFPHPWIWIGGFMFGLPALILFGKTFAPTIRHVVTRGGGAHERLRTWPARVAEVTHIEADDETATAEGADYRSPPQHVRGTAHVRIDDVDTSFVFYGPALGVGDRVTVLCKPGDPQTVTPLRSVSGALLGEPPA
jgi:hypothetical protein